MSRCWWWTKSPTPSDTCNCNIQGVCGTKVSMLDSSTFQISSDLATEIVAWDNITVTEEKQECDDWETWAVKRVYTLDVECCDKKVAGCINDEQPWSLDQKLTVVSPLTKTVKDCPSNGVVELWFDPSGLEFPDEKVKVNESCDAGYLQDMFTTKTCPREWAEPLLKVWLSDEEACKISIDLNLPESCDDICGNPRTKPRISVYLQDSITIEQDVNTENFYYISQADIPEFWAVVRAPWIFATDFEYWMVQDPETGLPKTCRTGYRDINMFWSQEQNKAVHWTRVGLMVLAPNGDRKIIIQNRYSGTDAFLYEPQPDTPSETFSTFWDNKRTTVFGGQSLPWTDPADPARWWWTFSMGRVMERFPVNGSVRWKLPAWTLIIPVVAISSFQTWDVDAQNVDAQVSIVWEAWSNLSRADWFRIQLKWDGDIYSCCDGACEEESCDCETGL